MVVRAGLLCVLLVSSVVLAGCQEFEYGPFSQSDSAGSSKEHDAQDDAQDGEAVDGRDVDDGLDRFGDAVGSCHDEEPPRAAHPEEQQVESTADLVCPGQFTVVDPGAGETWNVPTWSDGDWWQYRVESHGAVPACQMEFKDQLMGSGSHMGIETYRVESAIYECSGERIEVTEHGVTTGSLSAIHEDGFIAHDLHFPLRDGKKWQWVDRVDERAERIHVEAVFLTDYLFQGEPVAAWHVVSTGSETVREQWWGVEAQTLLREDHRAPEGYLFLSVILVESGP